MPILKSKKIHFLNEIKPARIRFASGDPLEILPYEGACDFLRSQLLSLLDFSVPEESLQNKIEAIEKQKMQNNKTTDSSNDKKEPGKKDSVF